MAAETGQGNSAQPQRRVCVACPNCGQGYRISSQILGRRLICRHCKHEWRAKEVSASEFRSGRLVGASSSPGRPGESLPRAGLSSVSIDMSWSGRQLGRYRVLSLLGHGGMGSVWRSHDETLRRDVALKILNKSRQNGDPKGLNVELFMQEARAVARLQHPSVVSIYEVVEEAGQIFLALELMEGGTLKEYVERYGRIPPRELFRMMIGPARALALAHRRGIIHRDIKPGNLMFDDHGHLKLMDFGLADVAQESASEMMRGKAVGSLGWIAPETARGRGTTAPSDIYGMGLVVLYALKGKPWFQSKSRSELIAMHQHPPDLDLTDIKGLTSKGAELIRKALATEQGDRYATADMLADALQECADEDPDRIAEQRKNYARIAVAASLFGAIIAASMVIYFFTDLSAKENVYREPNPRYNLQETPGTGLGATPSGASPLRAAPRTDRENPEAKLEGKWHEHPELFDPRTFEFVGSSKGQVFHRKDSKCGRQINASNFVPFKSYNEAKAAGRRPCGGCKPEPKPEDGDGDERSPPQRD